MKIFKRQKIPDKRRPGADVSDVDISAIVPIVCVEPIVVPERFKLSDTEAEKETERAKQRKESFVDKFAVKTSELDEIQEVINGH